MNFEAFDKSEIEHYKAEVKARWGKTKEYQEYEQKSAAQSKEEQKETASQLLDRFSELGTLRHLPPDAKEVQGKISVINLSKTPWSVFAAGGLNSKFRSTCFLFFLQIRRMLIRK